MAAKVRQCQARRLRNLRGGLDCVVVEAHATTSGTGRAAVIVGVLRVAVLDVLAAASVAFPCLRFVAVGACAEHQHLPWRPPLPARLSSPRRLPERQRGRVAGCRKEVSSALRTGSY